MTTGILQQLQLRESLIGLFIWELSVSPVWACEKHYLSREIFPSLLMDILMVKSLLFCLKTYYAISCVLESSFTTDCLQWCANFLQDLATGCQLLQLLAEEELLVQTWASSNVNYNSEKTLQGVFFSLSSTCLVS